jgi:glyoxylase-like metal-dependent hydrolase (beta-lactamase superfamily II)
MYRLLLSMFAAVALNVSAAAQLPPGMKQFETTKVADGVYSFRYFFHRSMFVVTDEGVIVTDPINPAAAKAMRAEIAKVTDQPVKFVAYSHEHWDHISGGQIFKDEGARFISHAKCIDEFKRNPNPIIVIPEGTFKKRFDIKLGDKTLELHYFGRNHGECLTVMLLPKEKIAFIVDIVTPKRIAFRGMPDFYPLDWVRTLSEIEKRLEFTRVIPGHGPPIVPASAVTEQREYLEDLMAAVQEARTKESNPDKIRKMVKLPKYQSWAGYNDWLEMNVERINLMFHMGK